MPQLIYHVDEIARKEGRGILYITFGPYQEPLKPSVFMDDKYLSWCWEDFQPRQEVIKWLDDNGFTWHECGHANWRHGWSLSSYYGCIYLDISYDVNDEKYMQLQNHLEHPDGTMRSPDVQLCLIPLEVALRLKRRSDEADYTEDL